MLTARRGSLARCDHPKAVLERRRQLDRRAWITRVASTRQSTENCPRRESHLRAYARTESTSPRDHKVAYVPRRVSNSRIAAKTKCASIPRSAKLAHRACVAEAHLLSRIEAKRRALHQGACTRCWPYVARHLNGTRSQRGTRCSLLACCPCAVVTKGEEPPKISDVGDIIDRHAA